LLTQLVRRRYRVVNSESTGNQILQVERVLNASNGPEFARLSANEVNFFGKRDGLVNVSQITGKRLSHPNEYLKEGQEVKVKLLGFDDRGKVRLGMKMVDQQTGAEIIEKAETEA
jgi:polyribonucleotide nucleotidyltransferase